MKTYAVRHKDEDIRAKSRSGGVFSAISDKILDMDGVIYGVVLNDSFEAVHVRAEDAIGRDLMRGSKYMQSNLGDTFKAVKKDLIQGRPVLFSGTSCQVAGLQAFLGKSYDNLLTVDIVCHGVNSPKIWKEYLGWQSRKHGNKKIVAVDFRNKAKFGWRAHFETLTFDDGEQIDSEVFRHLFFNHRILRPSCYECLYKSTMHPGDITIADYWMVENNAPEMDDNKGVSLVLVNTSKGSQLFEEISDKIWFKETNIETSMQPALYEATKRPYNRNSFWKEYRKGNIEYLMDKYGKLVKDPFVIRGFRKLRKIITRG